MYIMASRTTRSYLPFSRPFECPDYRMSIFKVACVRVAVPGFSIKLLLRGLT